MAAGDIKISYAASSAFTATLASLASDTNLLAGRESTIIDNTTNRYLDYLIGGKITTGTSPTAARKIEVWAFGQIEDTPTYPAGFAGSDAARTITSRDVLFAAAKLVRTISTSATSDQTYWIGGVSLASLFGGIVPKRFGLWVVHSTGVILNATAGNQALWVTPVFSSSEQ